MATITISGLPEVSTILDTSNIPVETVGITQRITGVNLKNYLAALPALTSSSGNISGQLAAGSLVVGGNASVAGTLTADTVNAAHGTITSLTSATLTVTGAASFAANISAQNFIASQGVYASTLVGNITTAAQPNITQVGTLASLTVTAPIVGSVTGTALSVTQAAQPAITSVGTLTSLTVSGAASVNSLNANAISVASLSLTSLTATAINGTNYTMSGSFLPTSTGTLNLGSPSQQFGTVYSSTFSGNTFNGNTFSGTASTAKYADLAECYEADAHYEAGTVLMFGTATEVTLSVGSANNKVAGVVSTNPAYLMNDSIDAAFVAKLALQGRVPCKVIGIIRRGDMLTTSGLDGVATSCDNPKFGTIIGKALQDYTGTEVGVIEVVVGRL